MDESFIKYVKGGEVRYLNEIVIYHDDGSFTCNVTKEAAVADGWSQYLEPEFQAARDFTESAAQSSTTLRDEDALLILPYIPEWASYVGKSLKSGFVVKHGGRPWRVRQDIPSVLENQAPGIDTAALYERIDEKHEGTVGDPIPYEAPMEIFSGKYYTEDGLLYLCTRDSGTALTHGLAELVGQYVEEAA